MTEFLIPTLTFVAITSLGGAFLTARSARKRAILDRLQDLRRSPDDEDLLEESTGLFGIFKRVGKMVSSKGPSTNLRAELAGAGFHGKSAPLIYMGCKIILLLIGLAGLAAAVLPIERFSLPVKLIAIMWGSGALFLIPNLIVRLYREKRRKEIRGVLPDAIDLLEICVSSGMGLDAAWSAVAEEIREVSPSLADEMALTMLEIHLGAQRATAMKNMSERTGAEDISSLVSVLVQSDRFGTSISEALKAFATTMREIRSTRAEESAEKMPVKLLFPLILFIFPAVLIVVAGPAAIEWMRILKGS
jgi:tight adherence protein C